MHYFDLIFQELQDFSITTVTIFFNSALQASRTLYHSREPVVLIILTHFKFIYEFAFQKYFEYQTL